MRQMAAIARQPVRKPVMLGSVGSGFIMGNAMPQLRAELPHLPVIGHCRNQAVSHYLTHWLDYPHLPYSPE